MSRILFFGSRGWSNVHTIWWSLDSVKRRFDPITIVHGGANGADSIANRLACTDFDLSVEVHYAQWSKHGRSAGPIRNQQMLDSGIDRAYGFIWNGKSPGSHDMLRRLHDARVPTLVHFKLSTVGYEIVPFYWDDVQPNTGSDMQNFLLNRLDKTTTV